jgi:hypothetical protein
MATHPLVRGVVQDHREMLSKVVSCWPNIGSISFLRLDLVRNPRFDVLYSITIAGFCNIFEGFGYPHPEKVIFTHTNNVLANTDDYSYSRRHSQDHKFKMLKDNGTIKSIHHHGDACPVVRICSQLCHWIFCLH